METPLQIKLILVGQAGIGKTYLACRFKEEEEPFGVIATIGVDCFSKPIVIDGKKILLCIWDTAGQERFMSLTRQFYTNADCAFICFSLCDISSMRRISTIKAELEQKGITDIYLIGTQNDSPQRLPQSVISGIIDTYKMPVFYTSAMTGENVNEAIEAMVRQTLGKVEKKTKIESVPVSKDPKPDPSGCHCLIQ